MTKRRSQPFCVLWIVTRRKHLSTPLVRRFDKVFEFRIYIFYYITKEDKSQEFWTKRGYPGFRGRSGSYRPERAERTLRAVTKTPAHTAESFRGRSIRARSRPKELSRSRRALSRDRAPRTSRSPARGPPLRNYTSLRPMW